MQLAECLKINANYSTIYTSIVEGHSDTCETSRVNFADTFHDMRMSANAVKSIKKAVNVILYLSRDFHYRKVARMKRSGCTTKRNAALQSDAIKDSFRDKHLCTFITLTLPSKQVHSDIELTKYCINPFLVYARKYFGVRHYIWKKELQENGNLHYHLVTDRYIDHKYLRAAWNRIINRGKVNGCERPFDYVDRYTYRMQELYANGFDEKVVASYVANSPAVLQKTKDEVRQREKELGRELCGLEYEMIWQRNIVAELERYRRSYNAEMQKEPSHRWLSPNSTDISAVKTPRAVSAYVAKYIAKEPDDNDELCQYWEQVDHYKEMIFFTLREIQKKKDAEIPVSEADNYNLEYWKGLLREARKFCPIQGKLWFKSATLTPFLAGAGDIITSKINEDLQRLIAYLKEKEKEREKNGKKNPLIVYSYAMKDDGTPDTSNIICITLLINIFQLQMMKDKGKYLFPNLVRMWRSFVLECKAHNHSRGYYERDIEIGDIAA